MTEKELVNERVKLVKEMREILNTAETENRDLTAEEQTLYDAKYADVESFKDRIDRARKIEETERELDRVVDDAPRMAPDAGVSEDSVKRAQGAYRNLLASTDQASYVDAMMEIRALQMDADEAGGYTVAQEQFIAELIKAVDNAVFMRQYGSVFRIPKAESLGAPSLDADPADPTWTAELLIGDEDTTMDFGKRQLTPHPLAQYIKVSKKLVRSSALNIDQIVRKRLAHKAAVVEETAFLTGSGANQPLGVLTASNHGISTGRDVSTGNTDTQIKADNLKECKYTLKGNYWARARWMFHRDGIKQIAKLKGGDGQYLWQPGIAGDRQDALIGFPVTMSEYVSNTFTASQYVGILGDFSNYWIADALDMEIQVLVELYAATNQNGYVLRKESDGMPVLEEAFVRVKLGA